MRETAFASLSASERSRPFLLMTSLPALRRAACRRRRSRTPSRRSATGGPSGRRAALGFAVRRMAVERARRRELTKLVADHFLGDNHRNVLLAVVDTESKTDELRQDRRTPRPDADHLVAARRARRIHLLHQITVEKRTLPDRAHHRPSPTFSSSARGGSA